MTILPCSRKKEVKKRNDGVHLTVIPRIPTLYYILNIEMTSQPLFNFCMELRVTGEQLCEVW